MDCMHYFMIANSCFVAVGAFFHVIVKPYPFMLFVGYIVVIGYYVYINYHEYDGWRDRGKIIDIYFSDDPKKLRHFVVYIPDENNVNKVFQHVYASLDDESLKKRIRDDPIEAVNADGSTIDIYSCGVLINRRFIFMSKWYNLEHQELCLGILKHDWEAENEAEVEPIPYTLITTDTLFPVSFNSCDIPKLYYMFGRSNHWQIDVKIKNKVYHDVSIYLHILDESSKGLGEWFWMYGISIDRKSLLDGTITNGERIYVKHIEREISLFEE